MAKKMFLSKVMSLAWQFVKRNGFTISEALKKAWLNFKLKAKMACGIVKFYYQKTDSTIREAYGTLNERIIPQTGDDNRRKNDTVQIYFDTEVQGWRCFKKANLMII